MRETNGNTVSTGSEAYLERRGWSPFAFQREAWRAWEQGAVGLIHTSTGSGKTLAAGLAPVVEAALCEESSSRSGLRLLWITPLRALAADTAKALAEVTRELGLAWRVETRTSDTPAATRRRQQKQLPEILVTTPESATLQLSYADSLKRFANVDTVIVDEWHELLGSKRGTQTELLLARLRRWRPEARIWGLSATLGNLGEAMQALLGDWSDRGVMITEQDDSVTVIDSLAPATIERFPWAGHIGLTMAATVAREIDQTRSCLVFANTRNQVERWYQALLELRPEWAGQIALHHGSLDRAVRSYIEDGIKDGSFRCVVCTSSLDLGVDFHPVERVFQVGSPKGIARLLQRAGRSGHQPGVSSRVTCVPAHAFELVEVDAARNAAADKLIEPRHPLHKPLDVLAQHIVTVGIGGGFEPKRLRDEVRTTHAYGTLSDAEWNETLAFAAGGGETLQVYDEYHRLRQSDGRYVSASPGHARRHRMMIGTITSDASVRVKFLNGASIGTVEETFIASLSPGDKFLFSGRTLELVRQRGTEAHVKRSAGAAVTVPKWWGGNLPLSTHLAAGVRASLERASDGVFDSPELHAARPVLELQRDLSVIPRADELLIEQVETRDGHHIFVFPFEGRAVHEGLATLVAWRIASGRPISFSLTSNDYGIELLSAQPIDLGPLLHDGLFSAVDLEADIRSCVNSSELAKRQFRSIARVSGLIFQGYPGRGKSARQLVASSSLLFDVFERHEPDHFLLRQARREVVESRFDLPRMQRLLARISAGTTRLVRVDRPTPLAFPILADRVRGRVSSESVDDRLRRMAAELESRSLA